jgi:hypothetical protein
MQTMLSPAFGAITAVWLMLVPALQLETGARAHVAIASGVIAFVLSPLSVWSRTARGVMAWVGLTLALVNFFLPCPIEALANFATCGMALILAGLAPSPVVASRSTLVPVVSVPRVVTAADEITAPSRAIRAAA